jgi:16S rRNA (adenine1518-N6/adenine1519-N6)-dimethyltransferase
LQGAVEIDQRAVSFLREKLPLLQVTHLDVLRVDWPALAAQRGGPLNLIGNLPYYITSQILFSLADSHRAVQSGVFTTQLEVGCALCWLPGWLLPCFSLCRVVLDVSYVAPS